MKGERQPRERKFRGWPHLRGFLIKYEETRVKEAEF